MFKLNHKGIRGFLLAGMMIVCMIFGMQIGCSDSPTSYANPDDPQLEAQQVLKQIYWMEQIFRQSSNPPRYGDDGVAISAGDGGMFPEIGVEIMPSALYSYCIMAGPENFTATAASNIDDDPRPDAWMIDETGVLKCLSDDTV